MPYIQARRWGLVPLMVLLAQAALGVDVPAPLLRGCPPGPVRDLGSWDDAFVCNDRDVLLLRRATDLFAFSPTNASNPGKKVTSSLLSHAQMVACAGDGERLWAFCQSSRESPFAIDVYSGECVTFAIPGWLFPRVLSWTDAPEIQSHVRVRHANAILLMIAGGDRWTWPRDGNRPLYFWMSLTSGKMEAFPVGWDLDFFSADQQTAVFEEPRSWVADPRSRHRAVDMRTGECVTEVPDPQATNTVAFVWTETQPVKGLQAATRGTGGGSSFAGLSANGFLFPMDLGLNGEHYVSTADLNEGWVAFRLRREGRGGHEPSPLWVAPFHSGQQPVQVATGGVTDVVLLGRGNTVFVSAEDQGNVTTAEAFFRRHEDNTVWNLLDGVDRLPPLGQEVEGKDDIEDKMSIQLVSGFGSDPRNRLVLCLFTHARQDHRSWPFPVQEGVRPFSTWRRAVLVTTDGQRYGADLFRDSNPLDALWLHNSGILIMASGSWIPCGSGLQRKVQVSTVHLLPQ